MRSLSLLVVALAGLVAAAPAVLAVPVSKCVVNGTVTYQQGPCPSAQVRREPSLDQLNAAEKRKRAAAASAAVASPAVAVPAPPSSGAVASRFTCDGRQHCSQMRSCDEAKFFLAHCPGVKMDGDRDGIPCEDQWCSR